MFLRLLSSSFLLLLAASAPVSSTELTLDTFAPTVAKGLWFVEHFSPYCGHCKNFKPTWDKLVVESETEIPQVKLATVDCIMHGDLCDSNGIKGYPTLLLFEDGKKVEEFRGSRDLDLLKKFMKRHVKEPEPAPAPPPPPPPPAAAPKAPAKPSLNLQGEVTTLSSDTFSDTLAKGPAFVKFYAPWCGHCKKLAPIWKNLARAMQNKLTVAEVNCDDNSALCKAQNIQGYPTLVWYAQGDDAAGRSEYNGGRKIDQLKAFAEKASAAGVEVLERPEDLDAQVAKEPVVYLLLHSSEDTEILKTIREASAPLLGSPRILASSSPDLRTRFGIPATSPWAIVAIKDHDTDLTSSIFHGTSSSDIQLRQWLLAHRLPTSLELATDSFQSVMNAAHHPLVVIAAAPPASSTVLGEKVAQRMRDVAKKWRVYTKGKGGVHGREVVFAWMDNVRWAEWLKNMYAVGKMEGEELEDVRVVITDHSKLVYYDSDAAGNRIKFTSSAGLFEAIEDAASGKSAYKNSENFIERLARSLNNKMQAIEEYVTAKPIQSVFFILLGIVGIIFVLHRLIGGDVAGVQEEWKESKGKNGRLD